MRLRCMLRLKKPEQPVGWEEVLRIINLTVKKSDTKKYNILAENVLLLALDV